MTADENNVESGSVNSVCRESISVREGYRQTRRDHATEIAEDYVELIDELIERFGEARLVDIASRIGVSHVTANKTIERLKREDLVRKEPYRSVFLTEKGRALARECRSRHEVVLAFLLAIGVSDEQAKIDAEGIEHHISAETLECMSRIVEQG